MHISSLTVLHIIINLGKRKARRFSGEHFIFFRLVFGVRVGKRKKQSARRSFSVVTACFKKELVERFLTIEQKNCRSLTFKKFAPFLKKVFTNTNTCAIINLYYNKGG